MQVHQHLNEWKSVALLGDRIDYGVQHCSSLEHRFEYLWFDGFFLTQLIQRLFFLHIPKLSKSLFNALTIDCCDVRSVIASLSCGKNIG